MAGGRRVDGIDKKMGGGGSEGVREGGREGKKRSEGGSVRRGVRNSHTPQPDVTTSPAIPMFYSSGCWCFFPSSHLPFSPSPSPLLTPPLSLLLSSLLPLFFTSHTQVFGFSRPSSKTEFQGAPRFMAKRKERKKRRRPSESTAA